MTALIEMPLAVYQGLLGRCVFSSREYELLKNSVVSHSPIYLRFRIVVEILCDIEDAKILLNRAKLFYPGAVSYIEEGIRLAGQRSSDFPQIKVFKNPPNHGDDSKSSKKNSRSTRIKKVPPKSI